MPEVTTNSNTTKVVSMQHQKNTIVLSHFFALYGEKTNNTFISFLDTLYYEYQKARSYQYLSFSEKVEVELKLKCLRRLLLQLQG